MAFSQRALQKMMRARECRSPFSESWVNSINTKTDAAASDVRQRFFSCYFVLSDEAVFSHLTVILCAPP